MTSQAKHKGNDYLPLEAELFIDFIATEILDGEEPSDQQILACFIWAGGQDAFWKSQEAFDPETACSEALDLFNLYEEKVERFFTHCVSEKFPQLARV